MRRVHLMPLLIFGMCVVCMGFLAPEALADPCGMIAEPPVIKSTTQIERVGAQKTYVFYKNGVESFVLRPGFKGKISNFGMLIPFPSVPAIRKVPNEIFTHVAAAVDPPEVIQRIRRFRRFKRSKAPMARSATRRGRPPARRLAIHEVRVVRQEAVGMYQVAVIKAGSHMALKRWMKKHKYVYPNGMDKVVEEYIQSDWVFVTVKARVSGKKHLTPRPGMREAKAYFPKGGSFSGKVQAMGFRFRTKKLVVPMRLSAFNKGKLHNIVYLLTDGPKRIKRIDKKYVVRQLSGKQLYRNVTEPLPVRFYGGTASMLRPWQWQTLQRARNPHPHNGHAKELFASDLLAVRKGKLVLHHENEKKVLLRIGERLRLRGKHIDRLHRRVLRRHRAKMVKQALKDLRSMTLTVIDGDFPRQVIAAANLTFAAYKMPKRCNHFRFYNARTLRRAVCGSRGNRKWGQRYVRRGMGYRGFGPYFRKPKQKKRKLTSKEFFRLIEGLSNPKRASGIVAKLVKAGAPAMPFLLGEAIEGYHWTRRGWSLVALSSLSADGVAAKLFSIAKDRRQHKLVRSWSAAAYLKQVSTPKEMLKIMRYARWMPALKRPMQMRLADLMQKQQDPAAYVFAIATKNRSARKWLLPHLGALSAQSVLQQMLKGETLAVRRMAASYATSHMRRAPASTTQAFLSLVRFRSKATAVPWDGGALYLPAWPTRRLQRFSMKPWKKRIRRINFQLPPRMFVQTLKKITAEIEAARAQWKEATKQKRKANQVLKRDSHKMIHTLLAWGIWCQKNKRPKELRKVMINLSSRSLAKGAEIKRYTSMNLKRWLRHWHKHAGESAHKGLLREAGVEKDPAYAISGK